MNIVDWFRLKNSVATQIELIKEYCKDTKDDCLYPYEGLNELLEATKLRPVDIWELAQVNFSVDNYCGIYTYEERNSQVNFFEDWNEFLDFFFEIRKGEFFAWMSSGWVEKDTVLTSYEEA